MTSSQGLKSRSIFSLVALSQLGVSIFSLPLGLFMVTKQGGWVSCLITGAITQLAICCIWYASYSESKQTSIDRLRSIFGRWIGSLIMSGYILYSLFIISVVLYYWADITRAWIFRSTPLLFTGVLLTMLAVYLSLGGIQAISRFAPIGYLGLFLLFFIVITVIPELKPSRLFVGSNSYGFMPVTKGVGIAVQSMLGFEILWLWIGHSTDRPKKILLAASMANWCVTLIYMLIVISCNSFFSDGQFRFISYPLLYLIKSKAFIFIERTDLFILSFWISNVLITMSAYLSLASSYFQILFPRVGLRTITYCFALITAVLAYLIGDNDISEASLTRLILPMGIGFAFLIPLIATVKAKLTHLAEGRIRADK
ncbi:GerAB/ArcD/ProY family transporter [Paenibacillus sp. P36]|uniref:GerAB/ArcD/ProY family transporter n=1 Tax=Paenibacillus sp. P36 TaxID=3342538 RepID=UPI0038B2F3DC